MKHDPEFVEQMRTLIDPTDWSTVLDYFKTRVVREIYVINKGDLAEYASNFIGNKTLKSPEDLLDLWDEYDVWIVTNRQVPLFPDRRFANRLRISDTIRKDATVEVILLVDTYFVKEIKRK